jgi:hypothetical protein
MEVEAEHGPLYVLSEKPVTRVLVGKPDAAFAILQLKVRSSVSFVDFCLIEDSYIRVGVVATVSKLADSVEVANLKSWEAGDVILCFFHWSID